MRKIVIVGAGPMGLFAAIELEKLGLEVIVIDPRASVYTRPGTVDEGIFNRLSKEIGQPVVFSNSRHIKDIERSLYAIATSMSIDFRMASFVGFEKNAVRIRYIDGSIITLPCDLVIDASGKKRVVVEEINKLKPDTFHIEPIDSLPNKKNLLAYVKINNEDRRIFEGFDNKDNDNVKVDNDFHVAALEALRTMGWEGFVEPNFYVHLFHKNKACFYVEIPDRLQHEADYETWLQKVMVLKTGKQDVTFQKIPYDKNKNKTDKRHIRFNVFDIEPHKVVEPYFQCEGFPIVVLAGDAGIEPEYRIGFGLKSGIRRDKNLRNSIIIDNNEFEIDLDVYKGLLKKSFIRHEKILHRFYDTMRSKADKKLIKEKDNYTSVLKKGSATDLFMASYRSLCITIYEAAITKFKNALNSKDEIRCDKYGLVEEAAEKNIEESILLLEAALDMTKEVIVDVPIHDNLLSIANKYKQIADRFYALSKNGLSARFYNKSLVLLEKHFLYSEQENILHIKLQQMMINSKAKKYAEAIDLANDALNMKKNIISNNHTNFYIARIQYCKALALICVAQNETDSKERSALLKECKNLIKQIEKNGNINKEQFIGLKTLFKKVELMYASKIKKLRQIFS